MLFEMLLEAMIIVAVVNLSTPEANVAPLIMLTTKFNFCTYFKLFVTLTRDIWNVEQGYEAACKVIFIENFHE